MVWGAFISRVLSFSNCDTGDKAAVPTSTQPVPTTTTDGSDPGSSSVNIVLPTNVLPGGKKNNNNHKNSCSGSNKRRRKEVAIGDEDVAPTPALSTRHSNRKVKRAKAVESAKTSNTNKKERTAKTAPKIAKQN